MRHLLTAAATAAAAIITPIAFMAPAHADPCDHHGEGQPPWCQPPPPPPPVPTPVPSGFNVIVGSGGQDRLVGTAGRDAIFGFGSHDVIIGRGGRDRLYGMRGNDTLRAVDGRRDVVNGGRGQDRCVVDSRDVVRNCETIIVL